MPLNADISTALQLLEHIQLTINQSDDPKLQAQTSEDLNLLISSLENPIFRSIVTIQDSLAELNVQLHQHPSILPVDFDINTAGELVLNLPPPIYYAATPTTNNEFDDQRVPVAKLSQSSSGEANSPPIVSPGPEDVSLPPITTPTYALEFQKAIEESSQGRDVLTVKLFKPDGCSLGFSVVGLRSEEKGELGIFVQEIQPSGIAGRDGRLHEGDQILAIDGQPLDCAISHQQAINILQKARGLVELVVARSAPSPPSSPPTAPVRPRDRSPSGLSDTSKAGSDMVLNTEWAQVEVIDLINDGSGLGFGIIGGRSTGVVVKTILPGGVADRDGRLQSGDHILQIGEVNLRGMGSEQVASVLRQSGSHVRLVVARPVEPTSPDYQALGSHAPIVPTKILADPDELDRHLVENGYPEVTYNPNTPLIDSYENPFIFSGHDSDRERHGHDSSLVVDVVRSNLPATPSLPLLTMDMIPPQTQLPEMDKFTVELKKDSHGLGITIAGYVCEKEELSGIFVKSISEGSAADLCKKIQVNDRIVEVDGQSLQGYTNHQAVEVLRATGQTVSLCLERYLRGPKFEQLQQAIANSELKPPTPSSPSATSLPRFPLSADGESMAELEVEVEPEAESQTTMDSLILHEAANTEVDLEDVELLIDNDYEGLLKPTIEAAIQAKWSKIMGPDVEIVVGQICKFGEGGGLGISLEGTVDVEDGQEVRPHHYIRSILAEGPVGQNNKLRSGDELLEVNGHRLLGMNHIEVVTILKDLPMHVRMVCARRKGDAAPYRLIDTSQDRAAFAARNLLGGSLQNLIPAMERLVKAKSDGSLASTATATATTDTSLSKLKSRSLEPLTGLAMWSSEPHIIELVKGERGLGFSILDYQDPMNPSETVIVIRSLVPGGVAQIDGRLIPGDRLLSVNSTALENASLDQAVQALKGAPKGIVRIGVAKPLPIPDSVSHSQEFLEGLSQATPTLDDHSMYSCSGSLPSDLEDDDGDIPPALPTTSPPIEDVSTDDQLSNEELIESSTPDTLLLLEEGLDAVNSETFKAPLPSSLEVGIKFHKGPEPLGVTLDCCDGGANGMVVTELAENGALYRDGHIVPGDLILSINNESLRRVSQAQARAILRRANLLTTEINVTYIPLKAIVEYRKSSINSESSVQVVKPTLKISPSPHIGQEGGVIVQPTPDSSCRPLPPSSPAAVSLLSPVTSIENDFESFVDCVDDQRTGGDATDTSDEKLPFRDPDYSVSDFSDQEGQVDGDRESDKDKTSRSESPIKRNVVIVSSVEKIRIFESPASETEQLFTARTSEPGRTDDSIAAETSVSLSLEQLKEEEEDPDICESDLQTDEPSSPSKQKLSSGAIESKYVLQKTDISFDKSEGDTLKEDLISKSSLSSSGDKLESSTELINREQSVETLKQKSVDELHKSVGYVSDNEAQYKLDLRTEKDVPLIDVRPRKLLRSASTGQEVEPEPKMTVTHATTSQSSLLLAKHWGPERAVSVLREPNCSLGISIVGGKVDLYNAGPDSGSAISGIFIKNVLPHSPAGRTGELKTGDRILEVDGIDLRQASHERAVDVIRAAGNPVNFLVQSLVQWSVDGAAEEAGAVTDDLRKKGSNRRKAPAPPSPSPHGELLKTTPYPIPQPRTPTPELIQEGISDEHRQSIGAISSQSNSIKAPAPAPPTTKKPPIKKYSSDSEDSEDEEDVRDYEGRIYTKKGVEISRASAGNVKRTKEEIEADPEEEDDFGYTTNKVKKKYGNLGGGVLLVQLERDHQGLGISLAGHKDRTRMAVFVCGINPKGSAHKTGSLRVGDEILEVNGVVLHGRCHLNASAIIKGLPGPIFKVIVLRRDAGLEDLAVKPITQFPVSLDDETPEQKYSNFKGLRTVAIKKPGSAEPPIASSPTQQTGQGLGIMIIEGRHAEVGQGIFISDIQEGSAAEQAGLVVGDMILAVNKDTLLGSNYDAAAALLKKTEGVVSLVVCNPNKSKDEEKKKDGEAGGKGESANKTDARTPTPVPPKEPEKPKLPPKPIIDVDPTSVCVEEPPADPATSPITPGTESTIEINKDKMGLGLSIVGGSDTLLGVIIIHEVYPDGAAAKDGRLKPGDQLLEVNSEDFRNISHSKALAALRQTPAKVKMVVYRDEVVSSGKEEDILDIMEVELTKKPGKGLGLSIVGRKNGPGIFISDVVHGGAAGADGRLMKGDQILAVNGQDLKTATQEEAAAVLKTTAGRVTMKLGRLKASAFMVYATSSGKNYEEMMNDLIRFLPDEVVYTRKALVEGYIKRILTRFEHGLFVIDAGQILNRSHEGGWRTVCLEKGPEGLGFSIVGGRNSPHGDLPIYVKTVFERGAAASGGQLRRGDQILAVDGVSLEGLTHQEAVSVLKRAQGTVMLTIQS